MGARRPLQHQHAVPQSQRVPRPGRLMAGEDEDHSNGTINNKQLQPEPFPEPEPPRRGLPDCSMTPPPTGILSTLFIQQFEERTVQEWCNLEDCHEFQVAQLMKKSQDFKL